MKSHIVVATAVSALLLATPTSGAGDIHELLADGESASVGSPEMVPLSLSWLHDFYWNLDLRIVQASRRWMIVSGCPSPLEESGEGDVRA